MSSQDKIIAVAIGDPNGIGPEIAIKAAAQLLNGDGPRVLLVGDPNVIRHYAAMVAPSLALKESDNPQDGALTFYAVPNMPRDRFVPGLVDAAAGWTLCSGLKTRSGSPPSCDREVRCDE